MPTGEYVLRATVDLSPLIERLTITKKIRIEQPPADVLDRTLARLHSKDVTVRRSAVRELFWFHEDGEKVGPALLAALKDPDDDVRAAVLNVLSRYPKQAAPHMETFLAIARGKDVSPREKVGAVWLLARSAPESREVSKLLMSLALSEDEYLKETCGYALQIYQRRIDQEKQAKDPR